MNENTQFDIIIIGGGMVGATLACALAESSLRIAILDHATPETQWPGGEFDLRVSAITRASQNIFENIGVWENMRQKRISPFRHMHVWDATGNGYIDFDSAEIGEAELGHIIENSVITTSLHEKLMTLSNVSVITPTACKSINLNNHEYATLELDDGRELQAQLVIGADGARSWLRNKLGIQTSGWSYQQKGLVTTVRTSASHQNTAWQRFLPTGPLAFLPLNDNYSSIVWSTEEQEADRLLNLSDDDFLQALNSALGDSPLGTVEETHKRAAFPLRLQHANDYIKSRTALIGDAAHTVHPLAGQGVNLGLQDVAVLCELILSALNNRKDIGSHQLLRRYERARKGANLLMMGTMDGFKRLFSNETPVLSFARNLGLSLTNRLSPIKNIIIRQAMGLDGEQASLARKRFN